MVSFRYYVYISDAKVDMLLTQIDPNFGAARRLTFGLNLKVLTASRQRETPPSGQVARLERVLRHLQDHGDVGTVDEPGQFFGGLLPMRWGPYRGQANSSLVFFGGRSERTVVGLGGSLRHVLGSPDADHHGIGHSQMATVLDGLVSSDLEDEYVADAVDADLDSADLAGADLDSADRGALARVHQAATSLDWPVQQVEFMAKRLLYGDGPRDGERVLLGSPIYVALVD